MSIILVFEVLIVIELELVTLLILDIIVILLLLFILVSFTPINYSGTLFTLPIILLILTTL